jgi:hypothetical protein
MVNRYHVHYRCQAGRGETMDDLDRLQQSPLPFATLLGIRFTAASKDRVTAELLVRDDLCTRPEIPRRRRERRYWARRRPCIAADAPWSGKPALPLRQAERWRWSRRRSSCCEGMGPVILAA